MRYFIFLLFCVFTLSGCDNDRPVINSIQGVSADLANQASITGIMRVYVVGKGFGNERGRLIIGDREMSVSEWNDNRILFHLNRENWSTGNVKVITHNENEVNGPMFIPATPIEDHTSLEDEYAQYIDSFALANGLIDNPDFPGWTDWMKSEGNQNFRPLKIYVLAFQRQLIERKHITISYNYFNDVPLEQIRPWPLDIDQADVTDEQWNAAQELVHLSKVREFLEACYPSFSFRVKKNLSSQEADIVVYANSRRNYTVGPTNTNPNNNFTSINITLDVNLAHEIGHFLLGWNGHHCNRLNCNTADVTPGLNMPPTTLPESQLCILDQGPSGNICNACAAGLGIPLNQIDPNRVQRIKREFNGRYSVNRP